MKDRTTGKRILVNLDKDLGPYIEVHSSYDLDDLGDYFDDTYDVLYWLDHGDDEDVRFYFGKIADIDKLQTILDEIIEINPNDWELPTSNKANN